MKNIVFILLFIGITSFVYSQKEVDTTFVMDGKDFHIKGKTSYYSNDGTTREYYVYQIENGELTVYSYQIQNTEIIFVLKQVAQISKLDLSSPTELEAKSYFHLSYMTDDYSASIKQETWSNVLENSTLSTMLISIYCSDRAIMEILENEISEGKK